MLADTVMGKAPMPFATCCTCERSFFVLVEERHLLPLSKPSYFAERHPIPCGRHSRSTAAQQWRNREIGLHRTQRQCGRWFLRTRVSPVSHLLATSLRPDHFDIGRPIYTIRKERNWKMRLEELPKTQTPSITTAWESWLNSD